MKVEKVILKKYVIIGVNFIIFLNVIVGEGMVVGVMSMVKESLDDWYIYVGIFVRKVKFC